MSNVKRVHIEAEVPFDFLNNIATDDAARLAVLVLTPTSGLRYESLGMVRYEPNEHGGQTAIYRVCITGEEAVSWGMLESIEQSIGHIGKVTARVIQDMEA